MPLDSQERRASAVSLTPGAPPSVTPNVLRDQEWRQESGWGYAAILVGPPVIPVPIPVPEAVLVGGVIVIPGIGIDRRRYIRWEEEVLQFWIRYFEEIVGLNRAQARVRAQTVVAAADQMLDEDPKQFWLRYFRRVRNLEAQQQAIELEEEEIFALFS